MCCSFVVLCLILGAFAKLQKANISFIMLDYICLSVCPSVCPRGTTRLPLEGFPSLIFEYFSKIYRENSISLKPVKNNLYFTCRKIYIFIISRLILLRMRNSSNKSWKENQNTYFMFNNFFRKSCCLYEIMWKKYWRAGHATDVNTAQARCVLGTQVYKYTLKILDNTYWFSTATTVSRNALMLSYKYIISHVVHWH
jgi:hypothetical protein